MQPETPPADCARCSRLNEYRRRNREAEPAWHNAPVPSFGTLNSRLLIVGLAPGRKGANRTGRPFTGDFAGDLLYPTLLKFGFAQGEYGRVPDDGLTLTDCRITNAVRCVPPENKPTADEIANCRRFLRSEIDAMRGLSVILALGAVAHKAVLAALELRQSSAKFGHGAFHELPDGRMLADSYHCSRYNTNTGRLTPEMFEAVFEAVRKRL